MTEEKKRMPCEVYSRVVGYLRPVSHWNAGKKQEWRDRKAYDWGNAVQRADEET